MSQIAFSEAPAFYIEKQSAKTAMASMHYHGVYELYYLLHGDREYFIGDEFYKLSDGELVLIPPTLLHRTAGKGATRYLVHFSEAFLSRFFTEELCTSLSLGQLLVFRPDERLREQLETDLEQMLHDFQNEQEASVFAGHLLRVLFAVTRGHNHYVAEAYTDERIGQIIRYINENYGSINDIEEIAARFFISKFHLCRIFNKNLGLPLVTYLNTIKIRAACLLMQQDKLNLTEIATRCGFNSSSYFCKVFKNEKGISPTAYRKGLQGK